MEKIEWHLYPNVKPTMRTHKELFYVTIEFCDEYGEAKKREVEIACWSSDGFLMWDNLVTAWARIPIPKPFKLSKLEKHLRAV